MRESYLYFTFMCKSYFCQSLAEFAGKFADSREKYILVAINSIFLVECLSDDFNSI